MTEDKILIKSTITSKITAVANAWSCLLYTSIMDALYRLKEHGYHLAIVSNKFDAAVKKLRQDFFDDVIPVAIGESPSIDVYKRQLYHYASGW